MTIQLNQLRNSRVIIVALFALTTLSNPALSIDWNTLGNQITTKPSLFPSQKPSLSRSPSTKPTLEPSGIPSALPSYTPSYSPSTLPSINPTISPSTIPTYFPSSGPTKRWSSEPSSEPSFTPSISPTTASPSRQPSSGPSLHPTTFPTLSLSPSEPNRPSVSPSIPPSPFPSIVTHHPTVKEISAESQSPSVERITSSSPSTISHQTFAPSTMNENAVQHQFLMELLSDKLMSENDVHHFEIEALNLITSSCQSLTDRMDFKSISFNDQHFSLAGGILIISFTIKGISRDNNDSSSDELEENIVTCFETHYTKLQRGVNAATGFFNENEVKEPKGANFPTTIVSVIGGCCIVALAVIFLVDRRLRRKRKTNLTKEDDVRPKDKNEPSKDENPSQRKFSRGELECNLSIDDYESNYNEIGYIKPSSRLQLDISVDESNRYSQGLAIHALSPLAQAYDTSSLGEFSYPDCGDERLPAQGRGHEMHCIADSVTTVQSLAQSDDSCLSGMKEEPMQRTRNNRGDGIDSIMQNLHSIMDDVNSIMNLETQHTTVETSADLFLPISDRTVTSIAEEEDYGLNVSSFALDRIHSSEIPSKQCRKGQGDKSTDNDDIILQDFNGDCAGNSWLKMITNIAGQRTDDQDEFSEDLLSQNSLENEKSNSSSQSRFSARVQQMEMEV